MPVLKALLGKFLPALSASGKKKLWATLVVLQAFEETLTGEWELVAEKARMCLDCIGGGLGRCADMSAQACDLKSRIVFSFIGHRGEGTPLRPWVLADGGRRAIMAPYHGVQGRGTCTVVDTSLLSSSHGSLF
jgi:hypothetical protein